MTTPTVTSSIDSQMHNNIMAVGSTNRPPMLATRRYPQWRSRFLRYIDTRPNGEALRKCILSGPYKPTTILVQAVAATDDSLAIPEYKTVETPMNISPANKAHFEAEKEAIHLILTGIGDEIYSTVDACQTTQEIWEAIERFYKPMNEMIRNNLTVATMQVNVQFLQQLPPEWSRFVTIIKQQHKLDEVSYHKLFDILKQYQKEVNELRAERLARNANPLALVDTAQANQDPYYQTSKSHKSYAPSSKPSIPIRTHTTTRYKGKDIAKPITPPSEIAFEEDSDPKQAQRDKDMQKNLALIVKYFKTIYKPTNNNLRTSSNLRNKNVNTTPRKPKRVKDSVYHKEKMLLCKQAEQGIPLQAEQYDWLADTDEEIDVQELKAHYSCMAKIQEVPTADSGTDSEPLEQVQNETGYNVFANDLQHSEQSETVSNTCLVETNNSNVIPNSPNMCNDDIQNDQNDVENSKAIKESKHNTCSGIEGCKTILTENSIALGESISVQDSCLDALQTKQTEFEKYKAFNDRTVDYDILEQKYSISFEITLQKCKEQVKNDTVWNERASNVFRKEHEQYIKIQDLKAQLQDKNIAISELKKLNEKGKGKFMKTKFDKPSVVRQPNAQRILKPSVLGKPAPFSNSLKRRYFLKTKSIPKTNVSEGLSKPVTAQTLPQTSRKSVSKTNVLKPGMYQIDNKTTQTRAPQSLQTVRNTNLRVSTSTGINHKTNVSKPQHKSNQLKDKVLPNNSQVMPKKTQVEEHPRISSISNKTKSVTACNDSLNSKTLKVNAVCATCKKCLVDSDHFACVMKMLNDVNARTKKLNVVPISTRKPKESISSTPLCLMAKASPTQAWLWHRRLSHIKFDYINLLSKKDVVIGLPKLKYIKDQLCSSCELSKAKRSAFKSKAVPSSKGRLNLLRMDLCGPMRVASTNGKKYILVIVDDYSRYTWTLFLRSKDETPEVLK
nr:retrovirus-related Pol polyprotein from transposon TNT 1-94 [Tanacetum cinerariifolium]